jgi:uncharacterized surface protein with fasciclin (FAS1) repeats
MSVLKVLAAAALLMLPLSSAHAGAKDIVDTAAGAGKFNTLVAAVKAAGLVETLKGKGPFTVFAPTDAAFAKLPEGTVENLLKPENKAKLAKILTYHVVPGKKDKRWYHRRGHGRAGMCAASSGRGCPTGSIRQRARARWAAGNAADR